MNKKKSSIGTTGIVVIVAVALVAIWLFIKLLPVIGITAMIFVVYKALRTKNKKWYFGLIPAFVVFIFGVNLAQGSNSSNTVDKETTISTNKSSESKKTKATTETTMETTTPVVEIQKITTEQLLGRVNDNSIKVGDKFHLTVELFESDTWSTGATGSFHVMAKAGSDDLSLYLANESDTDKWTDGTQLDVTVIAKSDKVADVEMINLYIESAKIVSGGTTAETKKQADIDAYYAAMEEHKTTLNQVAQDNGLTNAIDSIEPSTVFPAFKVNLSADLMQVNTLELKSFINTINKQLIEISVSKGLNNPQISYYIGGTKIGENRSILDPNEVKFKNLD
ncbi:hypothetical protein OCF64_19795 [Bacillus wiedmannii]|uniref:hypothetical protein n=1 Tax=Bacillus wiedmannii TaxID=1890302 RepID=UPI0021CE4173|nr:hypothetical protein [Bacillus wiedmannii]MCU5684060.1 hypothetical protein [Bacillus wiedmannii]